MYNGQSYILSYYIIDCNRIIFQDEPGFLFCTIKRVFDLTVTTNGDEYNGSNPAYNFRH